MITLQINRLTANKSLTLYPIELGGHKTIHPFVIKSIIMDLLCAHLALHHSDASYHRLVKTKLNRSYLFIYNMQAGEKCEFVMSYIAWCLFRHESTSSDILSTSRVTGMFFFQCLLLRRALVSHVPTLTV